MTSWMRDQGNSDAICWDRRLEKWLWISGLEVPKRHPSVSAEWTVGYGSLRLREDSWAGDTGLEGSNKKTVMRLPRECTVERKEASF